MKRLHRPDLFAWSRFHEPLNIDFNSVAIIRDTGNVLIDPLPLSAHDQAHLEKLGGAKWIIVTNSDHLRASKEIAAPFKAQIAGPIAQRDTMSCDRWLSDGEEFAPGIVIHSHDGSKSPGELTVLIDQTTLITGDLIRSHVAGTLHLLAAEKLKDRSLAVSSMKKLLAHHPRIEAVLVGDGWCTFHDGATHLLRALEAA